MPGTVAMNVGGQAQVNSVSCASAGECTAGGSYKDGAGGFHAFVLSEQSGVWGTAIDVPGTAVLSPAPGYSTVNSVSCDAPGNCAVGGEYDDGSGGQQAFVVDETNGVWGTAIEVPGTAALNIAGHGSVSSVSCAGAGECVAVGYFSYALDPVSSWDEQAFVTSEHDGVWGTASVLPGGVLSGADTSSADSVSCAGAGDCMVGGIYDAAGGSRRGFLAVERNGTWDNAIPVRWAVNSVSCASPGNCVAGGGRYVVGEKNGKWGTAIRVAGSASLNGTYRATVSSVSCSSAGNCAAGGSYSDTAHYGGVFFVNEKKGKWAKAIKAPATFRDPWWLTSISCASAGNCAAVGTTTYSHIAFVVPERSGFWGHPIQVPGTATPGGLAGAYAVSCGSAGNCAIGGYFDGDMSAGFHSQAFVTAP